MALSHISSLARLCMALTQGLGYYSHFDAINVLTLRIVSILPENVVVMLPIYRFCRPKSSLYFLCNLASFTVVATQVEVAVDQRSAVVEVLGHVVQPVGLHPLHTLVPVLDFQRDLHRVVLGLALPCRWVVEQGQELQP